MALSARLLLLGLMLAAPATAQSLYKCVDARGRISYLGHACESAGLKSAGEIREQLNVSPAYQPPPAPPAARPPAAVKPAVEPAAAAKKDAVPAKEPERRCFVVKTAKGPVTRCNEVPPEDDKPPSN